MGSRIRLLLCLIASESQPSACGESAGRTLKRPSHAERMSLKITDNGTQVISECSMHELYAFE